MCIHYNVNNKFIAFRNDAYQTCSKNRSYNPFTRFNFEKNSIRLIFNMIRAFQYMEYNIRYMIYHISHLKAKLKNHRKQRSSKIKNFTTNFYLFHFSYNEGIYLTKDSESMKNSESMNWETENSHQKSQSMIFRWILQDFTES